MDLNIHPDFPRKKDFRIGILGAGFIVNECHLPAYRKAGFNPVAIASRNRQNAEKAAQCHSVPAVHDSYEQLLADPSIEVLDIAVPPHLQLGLIKRACERRTVKGILAQKPLGKNYAEALQAVHLCEGAGIVLAVNQNMRYDQSVRAAKSLLNNGTLGDPVLATIDMRGIPHWMPWQAELGWATLRIMSIHHLDCFRYWFGEPERIFCSVRQDPRTHFPHADGICSYILEYASGLRCVAIDDTCTGPARGGCPADLRGQWRIEGTDGLAIGDIGWCREPFTTPSSIRFAHKGDASFHEPRWTESWFPDAFIGTMAQLLVSLENSTAPAISGRDNLETMALVEAAYESAKEHRAISTNEIHSEAAAPVEKPLPAMTPRAHQVLACARTEANNLRHGLIGPEHMLLGLLILGNSNSAILLQQAGLTLDITRAAVIRLLRNQPPPLPNHPIPLKQSVNTVLAFASQEAERLGHAHVGTEHILLGLLLQRGSITTQIFSKFDLDVDSLLGEIRIRLASVLGFDSELRMA